MKFLMDIETGIPRNHLFQDGKNILFIGAPTDLPLPTVDWVYGKYAAIMTIEPIFRKRLEILAGEFITGINTRLAEAWISPEEKKWLSSIHDDFVALYVVSQKISNPKEYVDHAIHWNTVLEKVVAAPAAALPLLRELGESVCSYGKRGFHDIGVWNITIVPKLQIMRKEMLRQGIIYDQVDENLSSWEKVYLQKMQPAAELNNPAISHAVFPQLPFRDKTFDHIVASWSMSTRAFGGMQYSDFMICWNEIHRVLKDSGDAFIFPLGTQTNEEDFQKSLEDLKNKVGMRHVLLNTYGQVVKNFYEAYTMRIIKE